MEELTYGIVNITVRLSTFSGGSISLNFDGLKDIGVYGDRTSGALTITTNKNYTDFYDNGVWLSTGVLRIVINIFSIKIGSAAKKNIISFIFYCTNFTSLFLSIFLIGVVSTSLIDVGNVKVVTF